MPDRQTRDGAVSIRDSVDLADLAGRLESFRNGISASREWRVQPAMTEMLGMIRNLHKRQLNSISRAHVLSCVTHYMDTGQVSRPEDIFNLCLGAGWLDREGKGILTDRKLRRKLLRLAETTTGRRKRLKAYRNLLHAYWSFPLHDDATSKKAINGWKELRDWLNHRHAEISHLPFRKPTWFKVLARHLHFLEEHPCDRYAEALLQGKLEALQQALDSLFIPADSWLKTEAVMAQITAACRWRDADFLAVLPSLLKVATGEAGIRVTASVTRRVIAQLVRRYAWQKQYQPHAELFLQAVESIGNPWRQRAAWDAQVEDDGGRPCALSREMIKAWLKDRLIGDFFPAGGEEASRCALWLRFSVFIEAIWVASPSQDIKDQALLVHIGEFLVIVPKSPDTQIEIYPWQGFLSRGGTKLLDRDRVDGVRIQKILSKCKPVKRLSQSDESKCDRMLRGLLLNAVAQ